MTLKNKIPITIFLEQDTINTLDKTANKMKETTGKKQSRSDLVQQLLNKQLQKEE